MKIDRIVISGCNSFLVGKETPLHNTPRLAGSVKTVSDPQLSLFVWAGGKGPVGSQMAESILSEWILLQHSNQ